MLNFDDCEEVLLSHKVVLFLEKMVMIQGNSNVFVRLYSLVFPH